MTNTLKFLIFTTSALLVSCGGGGGGGGDSSYDGQLAIVGVGTDLVLIGMDEDGLLSERDRSSLDSRLVDYNDNHVIFGIAKHPSKNMVFVTSRNECGAIPNGGTTSGCWGNARIDRFTYGSSGIRYDGLAFLAQHPLRISTPSFDAMDSTVSMTLTNQSDSSITITTLEVVDLEVGSSFTSDCDGVELDAGDTCDFSVTAGAGVDATGEIIIDTPVAVFDEAEIYVVDDIYYATGLEPSVDLPDLPVCASVDFNEPSQVGACALTELAITADGSRAYVNEDDEDTAIVLSIDSNDDMTFLSSDEVGTSLQGIAVNADNTVVYNGTNVYSVDGDSLVEEFSGEGGNATEFLPDIDGASLLVTTLDNDTLSISELDTDPLSPTEIDSVNLGGGDAVFQAHSEDLSIFIVAQRDAVTTATYDGAAILEVETLPAVTEIPVLDDCVTASDCDGYRVTTRSVAMTADGTLAISGLFVNADDQTTIDTAPFLGAVTSYSVDPFSAAIDEVDVLELDGMVRAMLLVDTP